MIPESDPQFSSNQMENHKILITALTNHGISLKTEDNRSREFYKSAEHQTT